MNNATGWSLAGDYKVQLIKQGLRDRMPVIQKKYPLLNYVNIGSSVMIPKVFKDFVLNEAVDEFVKWNPEVDNLDLVQAVYELKQEL